MLQSERKERTVIKRAVDIDGQLINEPQGYAGCVETLRSLIDELDVDGVDRSDIQVVLSSIMFEANYHLALLPSRQHPTRGERHGS